jgi:hypothetical protein
LRIVLTIVLPAIVVAAIVAVIGRFAPRAVGRTWRARMAYNAGPELLRPRSVAATFTAAPLSLGAGAPRGRLIDLGIQPFRSRFCRSKYVMPGAASHLYGVQSNGYTMIP